MSPIVGQFVDQQTSSNSQESLQIENTAAQKEVGNVNSSQSPESNIVNTKAVPEINNKALAKAEASPEVDEHDEQEEKEAQEQEETQESKADNAVQPKQSVKPQVSGTSSSSKNPKSSQQPKVASRPSTEPQSTVKPENTSQPGVTKTTEAGVTPKPSAAPSQEAAPKPVDPPKAPAKTENSNQNSTPSSNEPVIDTSKANSGTLGVRYNNTSGKRVKLMIEKGDSRYTYNLAGDGSLETFPLQSGNGEYTVSIMENTEGNKYRYVMSEKVTVQGKDSNSPYLGSIQMINWNTNMAAIKKAAELTSGASSDDAKVKKIYNYVVSNIRYDYNKLANLPSTYIPVIDNTYSSKSGICYDFASLTAAMLRSVGVPTKLVMGYADGVEGYHSWNEVYMGGKWVVIDTSYDSQMRENGASYSMTKSKSSYQASKAY